MSDERTTEHRPTVIARSALVLALELVRQAAVDAHDRGSTRLAESLYVAEEHMERAMTELLNAKTGWPTR